MNKKELAGDLRQRQYVLAKIVAPKVDMTADEYIELVKNSPDDLIIKSYITCAGCGAMSVADDAELEKVISQSLYVHEFLERTAKLCHPPN